MKKLIALLLLLTTSSMALADGEEWMFIGGIALGYILAQPRTVIAQPQVVNLNQIYGPTPIYQYQYIYDSYCRCYQRVLVSIN